MGGAKSTDIKADEIFDDDFDPLLLDIPMSLAQVGAKDEIFDDHFDPSLLDSLAQLGANITSDEIFDDDFDPSLLSSLAQVGTNSTGQAGNGISCCKKNGDGTWTRRDVTVYVGNLCEDDECIIMSYLKCSEVLPERMWKCSAAGEEAKEATKEEADNKPYVLGSLPLHPVPLWLHVKSRRLCQTIVAIV